MKYFLFYIVSYKYLNLTCLTTKMTTANKFAVMTGLPEYGERANIVNVNLDDVITYRVKAVSYTHLTLPTKRIV